MNSQKKDNGVISVSQSQDDIENEYMDLPRSIVINIQLIKQYYSLCSNSRVESVKIGEIIIVLNAILNILIYYIEDIKLMQVDYSKIGHNNKERKYLDYLEIALVDGEINISERHYLDLKIKVLEIPFDKAKTLENELIEKLGTPNKSIELQSIYQLEDTQLNRRESRILEDYLENIMQGGELKEVISELEALNLKYPNNKKVSEIYALALLDYDLHESFRFLKKIKNKSIIEYRFYIEGIALNGDFNQSFDELEKMRGQYPNEELELNILEAYINILEWKETSNPRLLQYASSLVQNTNESNGYFGYVLTLIKLGMGDKSSSILIEKMEPYYINKLKSLNFLIEDDEIIEENEIYNFNVIKDNEKSKFFKNSIGMEFILIPSGKFLMGAVSNDKDANDDEKSQNKEIISEPFYMGKYPVTQEEWERIMKYNPSEFVGNGKRAPVENVSWHDANEFIRKLNKKEGFKIDGVGYRLPTEVEWEYAARAGTKTIYSFGDDRTKLKEYAWYIENSDSSTKTVGKKRPNPWGLYDMHGNVSELCNDYYSVNYMNIRGGSWISEYYSCRSSARDKITLERQMKFIGFRLVFIPK